MAVLHGLLIALLAACAAPSRAARDPESGLPALISWRPGDVRVLLLTDCAKYQDWQTIAGAFAWRESGQPGGLTRVANCKEEDRAKYPQAMLDYVDTHMAPEVRGHDGAAARRGAGAGCPCTAWGHGGVSPDAH